MQPQKGHDFYGVKLNTSDEKEYTLGNYIVEILSVFYLSHMNFVPP